MLLSEKEKKRAMKKGNKDRHMCVRVDLHSSQNVETNQGCPGLLLHLSIVPHLPSRHRNREDGNVESHVQGCVGDVSADENGDILRAVPITHCLLTRVPQSGDGHARDPRDEPVGDAP